MSRSELTVIINILGKIEFETTQDCHQRTNASSRQFEIPPENGEFAKYKTGASKKKRFGVRKNQNLKIIRGNRTQNKNEYAIWNAGY